MDLTVERLRIKEEEFSKFYKNIPEKEKQLRIIERELEIKEQLFLLLLQKREEASINYAVVKPSIKIIDNAMSSGIPVSPNRTRIYIMAITFGLFLPLSIIYIWFLLDTKIHTKSNLKEHINDIPIIGEIPFIDSDDINKIINYKSRLPLAESIRMIVANLNFLLFNDDKKLRNNIILVTSTIKGEGKTVISVNVAKTLSTKFNKILLVGADLRNPQVHKFINTNKNVKGLSDYIYNDGTNWKEYIIKHDNLDIFLSGTIPPNPTDLLASLTFKNFINEAKEQYDYIVIDSAPCLLVSDTFEISKYIDTVLYLVRSNFTDIKLCAIL